MDKNAREDTANEEIATTNPTTQHQTEPVEVHIPAESIVIHLFGGHGLSPIELLTRKFDFKHVNASRPPNDSYCKLVNIAQTTMIYGCRYSMIS